MAVYRGAIFPHAMTYWFCSPEQRELNLKQLGKAEEELYKTWLPVLYFFLDCADEARSLMKKLNL
jgi:hypothetical protein